jgi:hypothetical protein
MYAAVRHGIKGNQDGNVIRIPTDYLKASAGLGGRPRTILKLLKFAHDNKIFTGVAGDGQILLITLLDIDKLNPLLLAPPEMLEVVDQAVRRMGGNVDADGMESIWHLLGRKLRPVDKEGWESRRKELRLKLATLGRIMAANYEGDDDGKGDDGGAGIEAAPVT